jgi:hypothetical protein
MMLQLRAPTISAPATSQLSYAKKVSRAALLASHNYRRIQSPKRIFDLALPLTHRLDMKYRVCMHKNGHATT